MRARPPLPVIPALDLWSLGHSATQVGEMLGLHRKAVTKIVERARSIGDPRAVVHASANGRLIGRPGRMAAPPAVEVVDVIPLTRCKRGHARLPENLRGRRCKECERARDRLRWHRRKPQ